MKPFLLILVIFSAANICYADDCTYDQEAQIELLKSIVKSHPGGVLNAKEKIISCSTPSASASSVQYGGCEHLVFTITKNISHSKKLSETEVFVLAGALAREYWAPNDALALSNSITEKTLSKDIMEDSTYYNIPSEFYYSFFIEHNSQKGYVSIEWGRNF